MNEVSTITEMQEVSTRTKNPFTGEGYSLGSVVGRTARLRDYINHPDVIKNLRDVLTDEDDAKRFIASVFNEIRKSTSDTKKDLTNADPMSLVNTMVDAATLKLALDGRQHAHIVVRGGKAQLQIGYRGYLARLSEKLSGFAPTVACVYKGDEFKSGRKGSMAWFEHTNSDPFQENGKRDDDIIGAYAYLEWVGSDGQRVSVLETIDRKVINKIMGKAQSKAIWDEWFSEKVKVAAVRRACKMHFAAVTHDLDEKDNEHFDLRREAVTEHTASLGQRIGEGMQALEVEEQITDSDEFPIDVTP